MIGRMTLKLERSKVLVDAYGEMIELTKPSLFEVMELEETIKSLDGQPKELVKKMAEFLKRRGMSDSLLETMEAGHVLEVCKALSGKKNESPTEA